VRLVIGTHSGAAAIRHILSQRGIGLSPLQATELRDRVQAAARRKKAALTRAEVVDIYNWRTV
jgi:isopropylmalate/homocitrate/citramalate synthase